MLSNLYAFLLLISEINQSILINTLNTLLYIIVFLAIKYTTINTCIISKEFGINTFCAHQWSIKWVSIICLTVVDCFVGTLFIDHYCVIIASVTLSCFNSQYTITESITRDTLPINSHNKTRLTYLTLNFITIQSIFQTISIINITISKVFISKSSACSTKEYTLISEYCCMLSITLFAYILIFSIIGYEFDILEIKMVIEVHSSILTIRCFYLNTFVIIVESVS